MREVEPACFAKLILSAVEYAQFYGFSPHPDFRHASKLLDGIDPSTCTTKFKFGKGGRPLYIQGPNETEAEAAVIMRAVQAVGGHFMAMIAGGDDDDDDDADEYPRDFDGLEGHNEIRLESSDLRCRRPGAPFNRHRASVRILG